MQNRSIIEKQLEHAYVSALTHKDLRAQMSCMQMPTWTYTPTITTATVLLWRSLITLL